MKLLRWLTVSMTCESAEATTVLSLSGCTRLRAVSGILRTQRGRRGSGGVGSSLRAPPPPARASAAGRSPSPQPSQQPPRPCGSSTPLAPVAHLWPAPGVAHCHRPLVSSRAAYRRARSPARIATVVLAGCSGAGSGWRCRARIAVCTVSLEGSATVGAGPLLCADSWAVTVWRIASAARLCQPRVTGLSTATQSPNSMAPLWLLSRPVRSMGPAGRAEARARAAPGRADSARVSHRLAHRSHWAPAPPPLATSPGHWRPSPPAGPCRLGCGPGEPDLAATATRGHVAPRPDSYRPLLAVARA